MSISTVIGGLAKTPAGKAAKNIAGILGSRFGISIGSSTGLSAVVAPFSGSSTEAKVASGVAGTAVGVGFAAFGIGVTVTTGIGLLVTGIVVAWVLLLVLE